LPAASKTREPVTDYIRDYIMCNLQADFTAPEMGWVHEEHPFDFGGVSYLNPAFRDPEQDIFINLQINYILVVITS